MKWCRIFKGLSRDGGLAGLSKKTTAPLSLMTTSHRDKNVPLVYVGM